MNLSLERHIVYNFAGALVALVVLSKTRYKKMTIEIRKYRVPGYI